MFKTLLKLKISNTEHVHLMFRNNHHTSSYKENLRKIQICYMLSLHDERLPILCTNTSIPMPPLRLETVFSIVAFTYRKKLD